VSGGGDLPEVEAASADVLVVGAGAAGLTAALGCAAGIPRPASVLVLTKTVSSAAGAGGASVWAQGGVASAVGDDDDPALHAADTLAVGAGLNDAAIVDLLTGEGPRRIRSLLALGARFDREPGGRLALGREAAHSRRRILHAHGDATGAEVVRTLVEAVRREPAIRVVDEAFALDLVLEGGAVVGLTALHGDGRRVLYRAPAVVLATGGLGQLFLYTTNPREATADGLAMAARAGARLVDLEFVQFHPTALAPLAPLTPITSLTPLTPITPLGQLTPEAEPGPRAVGSAPLPLLTEALRGEGAVLIDERGVRFMTAVHPDRELAPRDVVARAIWARLSEGRRIYLDARHAVGERFPDRFPTVFALCRQHGIDPRVELMPVVPAAHYHMGGVAVDASGRTSLPGLWACGEVAATGAHGANRLASNSLLEALVFGARVAEDVSADGRGERRRDRPPAVSTVDRREAATPASDAYAGVAGNAAQLVARLQRLMWERVGVERSGAGLAAAAAELAVLARRAAGSLQPRESRQSVQSVQSGLLPSEPAGDVDRERQQSMGAPAPAGNAFAAGEARNLLLAGRLLAQAALARRESRGGHYRADYPRADAAWQKRRFLTVTAGGAARFEPWEEAAAADPRRPAPAAVEQLA
jgi:L-aspartate oxidase